MSSILDQLFGLVMAFLILLATAIAGLVLTFDLSLSQIQHGLTSAWEAGLAFHCRLRPPAVTRPQKPRPAPSKKPREPPLPPVISWARRASEGKKWTTSLWARMSRASR